MAQIIINEFSDNYTFNVGNNSYATVALPITACWGPALLEPSTLSVAGTSLTNNADGFKASADMNKWQHFPATPQGLDAFVAAYRGPSSAYKVNKDYSYQMAVTLLTAGYDVLVYRMCSGTAAQCNVIVVPDDESTAGTDETKKFVVQAKYAGSFGNNIKIQLYKKTYRIDATTNQPYWNMVVSVVGTSGSSTYVENLNFVVTEPTGYDLPDFISPIEDIQSDFVIVTNSGVADTDTYTATTIWSFSGGTDEFEAKGTIAAEQTDAKALANVRFGEIYTSTTGVPYIVAFTNTAYTQNTDATYNHSVRAMEYNYTAAFFAYALLQDKLMYSPQRIIAPGWDDQNITKLTGTTPVETLDVAPLHRAIMLAAYYGRCGAGLLDIPLSVIQDQVKDYATKLSRQTSPNPLENNAPLFVTNCGLFAPWGQYRLAGMSKMVHVSPAFLALLISRAQILGQSLQYEWILPTNKKHNLNIGKLDEEYTKTVLDEWQDIEGVSLNVITEIPGQGVIVWGNSTLFDVPPATYQALANLSTRYLMNAVENQAYIVSLGITFTYNNAQALSAYCVGLSPILDTMKNAGAIENYKIVANPDINGEDHVNAQTIVGKVYMAVNGVVNDIITDLYALPPTADLAQFGA